MSGLCGGSTLFDIAHARAGDKGDTSILMVRVYDPAHWELMISSVTVAAVASHFGTSAASVVITPVPGLSSLSIVIRNRLSGGVTRSTRADAHGKTLSGHLLDLSLRRSGPKRERRGEPGLRVKRTNPG
ncbi:AtuA-related protein [Microbacterium resistens]|uniref:AtuA-related protein n=1 Tax=Microbacterium resistens TaxID=156977 RepID=UPI003FD83374